MGGIKYNLQKIEKHMMKRHEKKSHGNKIWELWLTVNSVI